MILHLTGSCPKNAIVSDFSGGISIPKFVAMFCNVNYPLNQLSPLIISKKESIFVVVDKVIPFV
jgi:hypothetical protein